KLRPEVPPSILPRAWLMRRLFRVGCATCELVHNNVTHLLRDLSNLWWRHKVPVILLLSVEACHKAWCQDQGVGIVVAASFDDENANIAILGETVGDDEASSATT